MKIPAAINASLPLVALAALPAVEPLLVTNPDGRLRTEVVAEDGFLRYRVFADGTEILKPSDAGLKTDHVRLEKGAVPGTATISDISGNSRVQVSAPVVMGMVA